MRNKNKYPKVLVFSNNCFSKGTSNGRTLANFFVGWPKENLAQFYIKNELPDSEVCDNYFRVTDREALNSIIKKDYYVNGSVEINRNKSKKNNNANLASNTKKAKRTPMTCMIRDFIWNTRRWKNKKFDLWVKIFSPEVILIQAGDSPFMLKLAKDIAHENNIPLVIYNSEDYYFKEKNYFIDSKYDSILYKIFINKLRKQLKETIRYSSYSIYNTDMLKQTYYSEFQDNSIVLMTNTSLNGRFNYTKKDVDEIIVSYLGNLGVGRHESLIQIAESINRLNNKIKLNIYGPMPNKQIEDLFRECKGIDYKGLISYDEVIKVMESSDLLIHAENFNEFYQNDLKHAFSTKIADSLASGVCFVLYAPNKLACTQYLLDKNSACVITNPEELDNKLSEIINNAELRRKYANNALKLANEKHNIDKNNELFRGLIENVVQEWR